MQGNYQYWRYHAADSNRTPADGTYANGKDGTPETVHTSSGDIQVYGKNDGEWVGLSLAQILSAEDWDIILIRISYKDLVIPNKLLVNDDTQNFVDINSFINAMEALLTDASRAKVKWGITNTWTYPEGCTRAVDENEILGIMYAHDLTREEYDALPSATKLEYRDELRADYQSQRENFSKIAMHMGAKCSYIVNTANAINIARNSGLFEDVGYKMVRTQSDTHLADGLPKYLCGVEILFEVFGVLPSEFKGDYLPSLAGSSGDGGSSQSYTLTKSRCRETRKTAWQGFGELL